MQTCVRLHCRTFFGRGMVRSFWFVIFSVPCRLRNGLHLLCCAMLAKEWSDWSASSSLCRLGQGMVSLRKWAFFRPFCLSLNHSCVRGELLDGETPEGEVGGRGGGGGGGGLRLAYKRQSCVQLCYIWSIALLKRGCGEGHLHWLETGHLQVLLSNVQSFLKH